METFPEHVERLRKVKGITQTRLINEAATYAEKGLSPETIRNAVTGRRGVDLPKTAVIETIAKVLDVQPEVFAAYRIGRARELFDPAVVGLATATAAADLLLSQPTETLADVAESAGRRRDDKHSSPAASRHDQPGKGRAA